MPGFFDKSIEYLSGVGPLRAELLSKELNIFTYGDLIQHFPFRYEDRTKFYKIRELNEQMQLVQIIGKIKSFRMIGIGRKARFSWPS